MRKEIIAHVPESVDADTAAGAWIDLEAHCRVRLTSEDSSHPIESALQNLSGPGWRAALPGPQTIWMDFDAPQTIREIHLRFKIAENRTQEFVLLASTDGGVSYVEIVRQQFNFSRETTMQDEHYFRHLSGVTDLKLTIVPDISGGDARATLRTLRVR
jgi:hypothetical protein